LNSIKHLRIGGDNVTRVINIQKLNICEEAPVDLIINGEKVVTFMCTPSHLKELAVGHLFSNGTIDNLEDIYTIGACDDMRKVFITSRENNNSSGFQLNNVLASSCGSGAQFTEKFLEKPKNESEFKISMIKTIQLAKEMFSKADLYKRYGGMHCASLSDGDKILALREDVGRHNAVDKVIGKGVLIGTDFHSSMIMTTGRISTDMILKAVNIGSPIIVSRSIPTTLTLEIAEKLGITIVGRVISNRPIIYTYKERIADGELYINDNIVKLS
jgi:FdhD protein